MFVISLLSFGILLLILKSRVESSRQFRLLVLFYNFVSKPLEKTPVNIIISFVNWNCLDPLSHIKILPPFVSSYHITITVLFFKKKYERRCIKKIRRNYILLFTTYFELSLRKQESP